MTAKLFKNEARRIHEAIRFHGIDARHWQVMKNKWEYNSICDVCNNSVCVLFN